MISCIIVDDEARNVDTLKKLVGQFCTGISVDGTASSVDEAVKLITLKKPDLVFLDIEMPEETGIQLLQSLPQRPVTIFTTAFLHYSLEGFELGVMDYLVKPIRYERFERAVKKGTDFLSLLQLKHNLEKDITDTSSLLIRTGSKKVSVNRSSITHVQALKDYAIIYCGDAKYVVRTTMKEMEELLGIAGFLRVHKSFIVSKSRSHFFASGKIEFENIEIPVGRKYQKVLERYLQTVSK